MPVLADHSLLSILRSLDPLLELALNQAQATYSVDATTAPYRGLYINREDLDHSFQNEPGHNPFQITNSTIQQEFERAITQSPRLNDLQQHFNLSTFDLKLIAIALAPEIDLRYERIYAFLQDDVNRKRPTVELALNLLCHDPSSKISQRIHLAPAAPLIHHGILHLIPEHNQPHAPFLAHFLSLDEQITRFILDIPGLDTRSQPFSTLQPPEIGQTPPPLPESITTQLDRAQTSKQPFQLYFHGMSGIGKQRTAKAIAQHLNQSLITVDLMLAKAHTADLTAIAKLLCREALCQKSILYLSRVDEFLTIDPPPIAQQILDIFAEYSIPLILSGQQSDSTLFRGTLHPVTIPFNLPDFTQRRTYWQTTLANHQIHPEPNSLNTLSDRFRLNPEQIDRAIATACQTHATPPSLKTLLAAARQQSGQALGAMARKVSPKYTWDDIILPPETFSQLKEVCSHMQYRTQVYDQWGFDRKLSMGKGINVLFSGPPGTGKTMAAEVIAHALELDLYKIDLSQIVSKYIGETEKNLDRIFTAAHQSNAILFFDEADALFGKRSEVKDAHDRYANIEVGYLLQKMEEYEGMAILATNFRQNMDDAFARRMQAIIEFPFPDEVSRHRLWQTLFPTESPLSEDVDLQSLAQDIRLAGGNIKNIVLAAAFYAASEGTSIHMTHLLKAAEREHQKLGRTWNSNAPCQASR
jgi:ATP-dependent 26S proteasome regulatory subunit